MAYVQLSMEQRGTLIALWESPDPRIQHAADWIALRWHMGGVLHEGELRAYQEADGLTDAQVATVRAVNRQYPPEPPPPIAS